MGPTAERIAAVQKFSSDAPETEVDVTIGPDGILCRIFPFRTNDVALVKLKKVQLAR